MINPQRKHWLVLGMVAYGIFMLAQLPARVLNATFTQHGINTGGLSGSLWHGSAQNLRVGVLNLGKVDWQWRFLPLLTGKIAADIQLIQADGHATGRIAWSLLGRITLSNLTGSLPLQSIVGSGGLPGGWVGTLQARFDDITLKNNWPISAKGELDIIDLTGPSRAPSNLGAYHLSFPAKGSNAQALLGTLNDLPNAAIAVTGTLKLGADRSYTLDTLVTARNNAPADVVQGMQFLGSPDARGRRPFTVSGTF